MTMKVETNNRALHTAGVTRRLRMLRAVACLGALALQVAGCDQLKPGAPPVLAPLLHADAPNVIPGQYLVIFKDGTSSQSIEAAKALARSLGATVGFTYTAAVKGFSAELPPAALAAMRAVPGVVHVEAVKRYWYETSLSQPPNPATPPAPGLDRIGSAAAALEPDVPRSAKAEPA